MRSRGRLVDGYRNKNGRDCSRPFSFGTAKPTSARRGGARGWRRQRCRAAAEQRRDAADGDAAVDLARPVGLFLRILRTVALRGQVFRGHSELLCQQFGRGFGAPVRQREIVDRSADRIGMALDYEYHARIAWNCAVETVRDHLQPRRLVWRNFPRSGFEVDGVEIDARHQHSHRRAVADFVERKAPLDPVYRWRHHGVVDQVGWRYIGFDDVAVGGYPDHPRP